MNEKVKENDANKMKKTSPKKEKIQVAEKKERGRRRRKNKR